MADEVRFGIIGLGMGLNRARIAAKTPGVKLAVVCSIEPGKAEQVGQELGCDWTTDYEEGRHDAQRHALRLCHPGVAGGQACLYHQADGHSRRKVRRGHRCRGKGGQDTGGGL